VGRYTYAYSSFIARLDEVEILRRVAWVDERRDPVEMRNQINALCRGAIVLLSAHLEAYIKELGEVALTGIYAKGIARTGLAPQFYYHISKDILDEVHETSEPDRIASKLFRFLQTDLPFWSQAGPFPQPLPSHRFNRDFSNPSFEKVRAYFNRFGYSEYKRDLARLLHAKYQATVNMVNHLVDTRNKIAHGDPTATETPGDVRDMIVMIRAYCAATDAAFASWCKANLCTIR
jgi:hypothetical protein